MLLNNVLNTLKSIAPLNLAEKWDNVGLMLEPSDASTKVVKRIFLTNDFTEQVVNEAFSGSEPPQLIVSYHPPIFEGLKSVTQSNPIQRCLIKCLEHKVALYSPHTAADAAIGGVNDWLARGLGDGDVVPVKAQDGPVNPKQTHKIVVFVPTSHVDAVRDAMSAAGAGVIGNYTKCSFTTKGTGSFFGSDESNPAVGTKGQFEQVEEVKLEMVCGQRDLPRVINALVKAHTYETPAYDIIPLAPSPYPLDQTPGQGRIITLKEKVTLGDMINTIKKHLNLPHIRLATHGDNNTPIKSVAVCAGAGGPLLKGVKADLYLTGEMRHHDVLEAVAKGTSVVLVDHSNCERGYLKVLQQRLIKDLEGKVTVDVSNVDRDPLTIV